MSQIPPIQYQVNIRYQISKDNLLQKEETKEVIKKFIDTNPIIARKRAISYLESYIEILMQGQGYEYIGIEDAAEKLNNLFKPTGETRYSNGIKLPDHFNKICNVEFVINSPMGDDEEDERHEILALDTYNTSCTTLIDTAISLQKELSYYHHYKIDTEKLQTSQAIYDIEDDDIQSYTFLTVPINWKDKNLIPDTVDENDETILELIKNGENQHVEFKPSIVYNFTTKRGDRIRKQEIAKTLCALANSRGGGILFIGVDDNSIINGLEISDFLISTKSNPRDYFQQELQQLVSSHFEHKLSNLIHNKAFRTFEKKTIFIIKVMPSSFPIFSKEFDPVSTISNKKFYYRDGSASREIKDVEDIVKYCLDRFNHQ